MQVSETALSPASCSTDLFRFQGFFFLLVLNPRWSGSYLVSIHAWPSSRTRPTCRESLVFMGRLRELQAGGLGTQARPSTALHSHTGTPGSGCGWPLCPSARHRSVAALGVPGAAPPAGRLLQTPVKAGSRGKGWGGALRRERSSVVWERERHAVCNHQCRVRPRRSFFSLSSQILHWPFFDTHSRFFLSSALT